MAHTGTMKFEFVYRWSGVAVPLLKGCAAPGVLVYNMKI